MRYDVDFTGVGRLAKENGADCVRGQRIVLKPLPATEIIGGYKWTSDRNGQIDEFLFSTNYHYQNTGLEIGKTGNLPKGAFRTDSHYRFSNPWREFTEAESVAEIEKWRSEIIEESSLLFLRDGKVWRRCEQPVLKLASKQYGWHTRLVPGEVTFHSDKLMSFHFAVNEVSDAREWLDVVKLPGRDSFFGTLEVSGLESSFLQGRYIDALNTANYVRSEYEGIQSSYDFKSNMISVKALGHYQHILYKLGLRTYRSDWPPVYTPPNLRKMDEQEAYMLMYEAALLTSAVRKSGKLNYPQQSKSFERHLLRWDNWNAVNRSLPDSKLLEIVNSFKAEKPQDHIDFPDDDDDDDHLNVAPYVTWK